MVWWDWSTSVMEWWERQRQMEKNLPSVRSHIWCHSLTIFIIHIRNWQLQLFQTHKHFFILLLYETHIYGRCYFKHTNIFLYYFNRKLTVTAAVISNTQTPFYITFFRKLTVTAAVIPNTRTPFYIIFFSKLTVTAAVIWNTQTSFLYYFYGKLTVTAAVISTHKHLL